VLTHPDSTTCESYGAIPINLHRDLTLRRENDSGIVGSLEKDTVVTLVKLAHEGIEFQLSVTRSYAGDTQKRRSGCLLEVIIYGPKRMADAVGVFMEDCGYFLQDPHGCDHNVPYINPHRLSSLFGEPPMTHTIQQPRKERFETFTKAAIDALANFQTSEQLEPAATPSALATELQL
jgi:hypothetical protein